MLLASTSFPVSSYTFVPLGALDKSKLNPETGDEIRPVLIVLASLFNS